MATAPVKPPLHNFPPRLVKWTSSSSSSSKTSLVNNHQRFRRIPVELNPPNSPHTTVVENCRPHHHPDNINDNNRRPSLNDVTDLEAGVSAVPSSATRHNHVVVRSRNNHNHADKSRTQQQQHAHGKQSDSSNDDLKATEASGSGGGGSPAANEVTEPPQKQWNLRPRRAVRRSSVEIGGVRSGEALFQDAAGYNSNNLLLKSTRLGVGVGVGVVGSDDVRSGGGGGKRTKLWIALSKEEIEEDIYSLTGSRPSRRPRKRPRNVQKQLDKLYPGLYLVGVSPESYQRSLETAAAAVLSKK